MGINFYFFSLIFILTSTLFKLSFSVQTQTHHKTNINNNNNIDSKSNNYNIFERYRDSDSAEELIIKEIENNKLFNPNQVYERFDITKQIYRIFKDDPEAEPVDDAPDSDLIKADAIQIAVALGFGKVLMKLLELPGAKENIHRSCSMVGYLNFQSIQPIHLNALLGQIQQNQLTNQITIILLSNGASPSALTSKQSLTPIHFAADRTHPIILETLINHYVQINNIPLLQNLPKSKLGVPNESESEFTDENEEEEAEDSSLSLSLDPDENFLIDEETEEIHSESSGTLFKKVDQGPPPSEQENIFTQSFFFAALQGSTATVRVLLEHNIASSYIDVNKKSYGGQGDVALHGAVYRGSLELTKYLLSKGADPLIKNHANNSPYEDSQRLKKHEITKIIQEHLNKRIEDQSDQPASYHHEL